MATAIVPQSYTPNRASAAILNTAFGSNPERPLQGYGQVALLPASTGRSLQGQGQLQGQVPAILSRARKSFYGGWAPDTLADDTRNTLYRGIGYTDAIEWLEGPVYSLRCNLDRWEGQPNYVEIWFEAAAMRSQFEYYTHHVTLRPFKGDPSLDFKWTIARHLDKVVQGYSGKPIVILYFGDLDAKGMQIPLSAVEDIRCWSTTPFTFQRCGLNPGDEVRYNIPENLDKPGCYQWEALADDAARTLILDSLKQYVDLEAQDAMREEEERIEERFKEEISEVIAR